MQTLRICDVGLSADASHALHSMLKVVDGRSSAAWRTSHIDLADVLIARADGADAELAAWNRTAKPVVLVIDDRSSWPSARFVLRQPFRVMQLLTTLDDVAGHLGAPIRPEVASGAAWACAESLRRHMEHRGQRGWQVATDADGAAAWVGDGCAHVSARTLQRLRTGQVRLGAFDPSDEAPPAGTDMLASADLAWHVGLRSDGELAPWLSADFAYRLRRWPDLGRLGASADLIELSAFAAHHASVPAALAERSGHALADVHRFLTAASLAGLLAEAKRAEGAPVAERAPGGWMKFVGGLRRHLRRMT